MVPFWHEVTHELPWTKNPEKQEVQSVLVMQVRHPWGHREHIKLSILVPTGQDK